jgi:hypothetical protein
MDINIDQELNIIYQQLTLQLTHPRTILANEKILTFIEKNKDIINPTTKFQLLSSSKNDSNIFEIGLNSIVTEGCKSIYLTDKILRELFFYRFFSHNSVEKNIELIHYLNLSINEMYIYIDYEEFVKYYNKTKIINFNPIYNRDYFNYQVAQDDFIPFFAKYDKSLRWLNLINNIDVSTLQISPNEIYLEYITNVKISNQYNYDSFINNNVHSDLIIMVLNYNMIEELDVYAMSLFLSKINSVKHYFLDVTRLAHQQVRSLVALSIRNKYFDLLIHLISNGYKLKYYDLLALLKECEKVIISEFTIFRDLLTLIFKNIPNINVFDILESNIFTNIIDSELGKLIMDVMYPFNNCPTTLDVIVLYSRYLHYVPNIERFGFIENEELYKKFYDKNYIPLYYLERFTHCSKEMLAKRLLCSTEVTMMHNSKIKFINNNIKSIRIKIPANGKLYHDISYKLYNFIKKLVEADKQIDGYMLDYFANSDGLIYYRFFHNVYNYKNPRLHTKLDKNLVNGPPGNIVVIDEKFLSTIYTKIVK